MNNNKFLWATAICALFVPLAVHAQSTAPSTGTSTSSPAIFDGTADYRTFSIGINGGGLGAVSPTGGSNDFTKWKADFGYGAYVKWQLLHSLALRADYLGGKLTGNNDDKLGNGTTSNSPYSEFETKLKWTATLSAVATVANINWLHRKNFVQIYVSAGGGIAGYSPRITPVGGAEVDYKAGGKNIQELVIPVGAGLKFKLSEGINLDLGYTTYFTDGDNLDGYVHGSQKDKFSYGYAGLEFVFGKHSKPQLAFSNPAAILYDKLEAQKAATDQVQARLNAEQVTNDSLSANVARLTADQDGDGVSDFFDKCPGTPAGTKVDGSGCPLPVPEAPKVIEKVTVTEEDNRVVREAVRNLEFATGKSNILPHSYETLNKVAELLTTRGFSLKLAGHTDNVGSDSKNMILSKDRAEAVKAYLVGRGANPTRIEAVGYGETQPIASNKTPQGRQANRRVEFTIY
ncbi:OmpA-OmpF porin, OOP family [Chitinophaga costaii]|uniref:OmpA-OmpF porin, OOP family n=1 Tax=Chitinophaga costaii TaxID=1335309 RepID=A0A1C4FVP2_9BACT|nr:OmpA family protein [Chitinophaga costaii]PUZ27257.1 OmpA family protein [Chitinophaga costaii]SCC59990.1 OmpA-OmpF porin, OOP family [Chitinophaga costaii]